MRVRSLSISLLAVVLVGCGRHHDGAVDGGVERPSSSGDAPVDSSTPEASADAEPAIDASSDLGGDVADASSDADASSAGDAPADLDASPPTDAPTEASAADAPPHLGIRAIQVAVGEYHTCALLENRRVKCWGYGDNGQLGRGDKGRYGAKPEEMGDALPYVDLGAGRTAKAISAKRYATCAILDTDDVKCWGRGVQAGLPIASTADANRGDEPGEMGDALPTVDLGVGHKAKRIAVGASWSCAQREDDSFKCWRDATATFELAARAGYAVTQLVGGYVVLALYDDGLIRAITNDAGLQPLATSRAIAVNGNSTHVCAALGGGGLACTSGLPPSVTATATARALAMPNLSSIALCGLRPDNQVSCWGYKDARWPTWTMADDGGTLIPLGQPVQAIADGGLAHACALLGDGGIKCWLWDSGPPPPALGASWPDGTPKPWLEIDLGTRP
jgi:hypothetical protein